MQLEVKKLRVTAQFLRSQGEILRGIDFCVRAGEPLGVVGDSGSGKTMSALAILGLLPENCDVSGSATLDGVELIGMKERRINAMRGRELVYIPQSGSEYLSPSLKIKTQLYESLRRIGIKGGALRVAAIERLEGVGLSEDAVLEKYPHQLSGGQAQRVVLAMSLASAPKLVIADEPTRGIDRETAKLFEGCISERFADACVIVITHSLELARTCKNVLVLKDGEVQEYGSADVVLSAPKSEYTKRLIEAECEGEDYA